jgi:hypothetical protein
MRYHDLLKIQALDTTDGNTEIGYTSYKQTRDAIYIELTKVRPEYRHQRIGERTLLLAVAATGAYTIYTKGLTVAGKKFMGHLQRMGYVSVFDDSTIFINEAGMSYARALYKQEILGKVD